MRGVCSPGRSAPSSDDDTWDINHGMLCMNAKCQKTRGSYRLPRGGVEGGGGLPEKDRRMTSPGRVNKQRLGPRRRLNSEP